MQLDDPNCNRFLLEDMAARHVTVDYLLDTLPSQLIMRSVHAACGASTPNDART